MSNNTIISATNARANGSPVYAVRQGALTRGFVERTTPDFVEFGKWTSWCKTCTSTVQRGRYIAETAEAVLDHWAVEHR